MAASSCSVASGFSKRSFAVSRSLGGRSLSWPRFCSFRMAATCSIDASTTLVRFAVSQLTRRLTPLRRSFSTLASITPIAQTGAPMAVRKSSMRLLCLKYRMLLPPRVVSFGEKPASSSSAQVSRLTL